jgi:hypothetical protein
VQVKEMPEVSDCTASKLVAAALTCGLVWAVGLGQDPICVFSSPVSDHDPGLWLAGVAGA